MCQVIQNVTLASISALEKKTYDLSPISVLPKEIPSICISSLESFEFSFAPPSCNIVAEIDCIGWEGAVPDFVCDLVAIDIAEQSG
jgi:hypothetical protein